jgi:hypothetical protein
LRKQHAPLIVVLLLFAILIPLRTYRHGDDFEVFWRAARVLFSREPIYSVGLFGNMVFKYPPWILAAFVPLAALPLAAAKIAYGLVQVYSLLYVVLWLLGRGVRSALLAGLLVAFGGVILLHANVGQVTMPLLAICLAGVRLPVLAWALSVKVTTAFPLLGFDWSRPEFWRGVLSALLIVTVLSVPVVALSYGWDPVALLRDWLDAMFSGTRTIDGRRIGFMTRECQGLPAVMLRVFSMNEESRVHVLIATAVPVVAVFVGWKAAIRRYRLAPNDAWLGWLALMPVVQPLGWFHFFWMAFPVAAIAMDRALRERRKGLALATCLGILLVAAATEKTLGSVGTALELAAVKSWGTLVCLACFAVLSQARRRRR